MKDCKSHDDTNPPSSPEVLSGKPQKEARKQRGCQDGDAEREILPSAGINSVITDKCLLGLHKKCIDTLSLHYIHGVYSPLKPRAWAKLLFYEEKCDSDALCLQRV